jgi:hypothetical protein
MAMVIGMHSIARAQQVSQEQMAQPELQAHQALQETRARPEQWVQLV